MSVFMGQLCWPANRMLGRNISICIDKYLCIKKVDEVIDQEATDGSTLLKPLQENNHQYQHY